MPLRGAIGCAAALLAAGGAAHANGTSEPLAPLSAAALNLSFEAALVPRGRVDLPAGWVVGGQGYEIALDGAVRRDGARSLRLRYDGPSGKTAAGAQRVDATALVGRRVELSGWLRRANAHRGSLGFWLRVEAANGDVLRLLDQRAGGVTSDQDWKQAKLAIYVPAGARWLHFGLVTTGDGTAWVDGLILTAGPTTAAGPMRARATIPVSAQHAAPAAVVDWLRGHQISLGRAEPTDDIADLEPLLPRLRGARIVAMGEATHGTREFFELKHRVLQLLVTKGGVRTFAIEANEIPCRKLGDYVLGAPLPREQALAGLFGVWKTEEVLALIEWLRSWNATHSDKVRLVGFDMQDVADAGKLLESFLRGAGELDAEARLAPLQPLFDGQQHAAEVLEDERRWAAIRQAVAALVERFTGRQSAWSSRLGAAPVQRARHDLRLVEQALDMALANAGVTGTPAGVSAIRDRAMAENVLWQLEQAGAGARVFLWAHNFHVSKQTVPSGPTPSMGAVLRATLGAAYVPIGFEFGDGAFQATDMVNAPYGRAMREFVIGPPSPGSLAAAFRAAGIGIAAVDLREFPDGPVANWLSRPQPMHGIGFAMADGWDITSPLAVTDAYDLLIYVDHTTRARPLDLYRPGDAPMRKPDA